MKNALSRFIAGLAVLVLCAVATGPAQAQTGKLTGIVTDAATGQPLEGAQVLLQGTGLSALTVASGRFFIVNVPPATYTVLARRIGYQSVEVRNVVVQIDVTRTVDVAMTQSTAVLEAIRVEDVAEPLVEPGITGSGTNIRAEEISALPVTNIQGVLSLQQGFLEIPQNTDIVSFTDTRRNPLNPISIRGGRAGETLTLVDGIPINNFVFGGPAFDITNEAVEQVDYQRGGFEPQYGNALSGIINIATREGGANLSGAFSYQTSAVGGALGSTPDDLSGFNLYQGFISGPVPGLGNKLRFMLAGRSQSGADRVLKFDDDIFRASAPRTGNNQPHALDLFTGYRALGYDEIRDGIAKLTFYFQPTMKLNVPGIKYERQRLPFDFDWLLTGFNALEATGILNIEDTLTLAGGNNTQRPTGNNLFQDVVRGSIRADRELFSAKWDHTIGRWAYTIAGGRFTQERETCNFFQGVCLGQKFADVNFTGRFVAPITQAVHPAGGTDEFFGGERLETLAGRVDIQGQATDHHAVRLGAFYQRHDLKFEEFRNLGVNNVVVIPAFYQDKPWDAAAYLQDKIEYDFLTIKLGARFDFGQAGGLFFADPRDPTNGTTAREVCEGTISTINGGAPFSEGSNTGFAACTANRALMDSAATLAQFDDFVQSRTRSQFSPRIGVSFPLTERSTVFFNFGRYSQNPLYNNLFQNTGIGTTAGEEGGVCGEDDVVPGTTQCHPIIFSDIYTVSFLGNPNLLIEKTTSYEMGFATELGDAYALQVTAFSKDQFGLSGLRQGGRAPDGSRLFDVGATYGGQSQYNYYVIVNQDFQTVRGFEISLRRRLTNYWGFNINYTLTQSTTNASAPDQEFQRQAEEGDPSNLQEIRSQLDQPHSFNASLNFRAGPQDQPFGVGLLDAIVRNANASVTVQAASGLPYTPTLSFTGFGDQQLARNSGRAPARFNMNMQVGKNFNISNIRAGAFVRVANLLNTRNCIQVFPSTGRCDGGTPDQSRDRQGNTVGEGTFSTYFDRPQFYTSGREINAGLRFDF
ncbi:MAG TPA: TonB-dependent receptor [Gemmatimonadales bacterium]|nr:TonB-dependent receptor [Gemmatimonadales bacterium]